MPDIDAELVERVTRWCADAGRQTGAREIQAALSKLSWDELLAARALLADPPPARPLGPFALADIARGAPADVAAERERGGRYAAATAEADAEAEPGGTAPERTPSPRARRPRAGGRKAASVVIHRARDRAPPPPDAPPPLPDVAELRRPEGRNVLERLLRARGARRAAVVADLSRGWRRPDGAPASGEDLAALLEHHGLARAFERRERDELLHALRAEGGVRGLAAARLGLDAAGLSLALERLGATADAERIRGERRRDLRLRGTLSERVHLLLSQEERLRDLELLAEFEADLRTRLPELVRALRETGAPLAVALARSLSLPPATTKAIAARFELELGEGAPATAPAHRREGRPGDRPRPASEGGLRRRERPGSGPGTRPRGRPRPPGRAQRPEGRERRERDAPAAPDRGRSGAPPAPRPARRKGAPGAPRGPRARPAPSDGGRRPPRRR